MEARIWHQHYDPGVPIALDYPNHPVDKFLTLAAEKYPNRDALVFSAMAPLLGEQHSSITYRLFEALANRFAVGLQQHGLKKGDRVALYMPNCPQYEIAYYGILRAGGIAVPSNPLYVAREIEHQLKDSGAKFVVVLSMMYPNIKQVRANTKLEQVIVTNIKEYMPGLLKFLFTLTKEKKDGHRVDISGDKNTIWFNDFLGPAGIKPEPVEVDIEDTAVLMYTGGTTGVPKGAQLTHRNVTCNPIQGKTWIEAVGATEGEEVMLTALPLTHSYSMTACMNLGIRMGSTQILIPNPRDLIHVLSAIQKYQATILPGVPTLYNVLANHPEVISGKYSMRSIKVCISGASALPAEVQTAFIERTGAHLVEVYGLSETSPALTANPLNSGGRIGTIGVPLPDTDIKLMDEELEETSVGYNTPGVLCARGPQVMKGYWNMPTETANVLRTHKDGHIWLHSGDIAEMSEDGYIRIVDRKKDMILAAGGYNVYPRDIEERLYEHPKVLEAAAIGIPPGSQDQRAKAFVVLHTGQTSTEAEMIKWCREGLAKYKIPKQIEFRKELPKTMVGKVLRRALVEQEAKKIG
ncbi:long-chain fatty acid--CoA ligase [Anaerolineales bacterium HSG24]|nr:long-chain fatty acid--CoA ligase [Anaerolineales bacterium HSG24]